MDVKYNNLPVADASSLITFTDIPNIVSIEGQYGGVYEIRQLKFQGCWDGAVPYWPGTWYISINGDTIKSVRNYPDAVNKNFLYMTSERCVNDNDVTAMTAANALRNCPNVTSSWRIEYTGGSEVYLYSREPGRPRYAFDTNMPASIFENNVVQRGEGTGGLDSGRVGVDVYANGQFYTSLVKNFYGGYCAFNVSPVLASIAEEGKSIPYTLKAWTADASGNYNALSTIGDNYISQGYMCNLGNKYIKLLNQTIIAQNMSRGETKLTSNNSTLYVYGNTILMSFYALNSRTETLTIKYKNHAYNDLHTVEVEKEIDVSNSKLVDITINLNEDYLKESSYIDVYFNSTYETIRYNVIRPMKATEYYQRICWRNSYGGISFFDFTGARTEVKELETTTYNKNIFDYYTSKMDELEKVYNTDVNYTVTIKSHIVDKDGSYIFNDLMQSPMVWTYIDGSAQAIIIEEVGVDEVDTNDIYEAKVRYRYSMPPSII